MFILPLIITFAQIKAYIGEKFLSGHHLHIKPIFADSLELILNKGYKHAHHAREKYLRLERTRKYL